MKHLHTLILLLILAIGGGKAKAQQLYFPPLAGTSWDTVSPSALGWCTSWLDSASQYLQQKNTKGFLILEKGKIAYERYYGTFTRDSLWYWASASKSLTAVLCGIAQEKGLLSINQKVSQYLGTGWTVAPLAKENLITVRHLLTMTSGLNDGVVDPDCSIDTCLKYLADAGTRWAYHNGAYHCLIPLVDTLSSLTYTGLTQSWIRTKTGMGGLWYQEVYYSKLRDMARFGLLSLARGNWNGQWVLQDTAYWSAMLQPSQSLNPSYGYLWWLNGQSGYRLPQTQLYFTGPIIPNAPSDMVAALGKNDQKVYVCPSQGRVIVRLGDASGTPMLALSSFDNQLWYYLSKVFCAPTSVQTEPSLPAMRVIYSDFGATYLELSEIVPNENILIWNLQGQKVSDWRPNSLQEKLPISNFAPGMYVITYANQRMRLSVQP